MYPAVIPLLGKMGNTRYGGSWDTLFHICPLLNQPLARARVSLPWSDSLVEPRGGVSLRPVSGEYLTGKKEGKK